VFYVNVNAGFILQVGPAVTVGGQAADVPHVDQSAAPASVEQHLLQLLLRKQRQQQSAVAVTTPQQQQALLQLLMHSQASSAAQAVRQTSAAAAFSLASLPTTAAVPTSQGPRPRAIKSQHSQPQQLTDAMLQQQQQALQHDVLKTEAAKLAEASKLAELRYILLYTLYNYTLGEVKFR